MITEVLFVILIIMIESFFSRSTAKATAIMKSESKKRGGDYNLPSRLEGAGSHMWQRGPCF
jgi:hypothetical protein